MIKKTKYRIQDILQGHMKNEEKSAQKTVQTSYIEKNKREFDQLAVTLSGRKLTFAKFGFQQAEIIEDRKLGPVIRGMCDRERLGSMSVAELVTKKQLNYYLCTSSLEPSKRLLKRYAHWEWDQQPDETKTENKVFTGKVEADFKEQVKAKGADKRLKKQIYRKWANNLPDVMGFVTFAKSFNTPISSSMDRQPYMRSLNDQKSIKKTSSFYQNSLQTQIYTKQQNLQVSDIITQLDEIHRENKKEKRMLRFTLNKIQDQILKHEQIQVYSQQNPYGSTED